MTAAKHPHDSRSDDSEQWEIVDQGLRLGQAEAHIWRLVVFKNGRGELRHGLKCDWCAAVRIPNPSAWNGHGQRVERSKP